MKHLLGCMVFILMLCNVGQSQDNVRFPKGEKGYEQTYQRNIKKSRINGVYIPKDLDEACAELTALSPEASLEKFKRAQEDFVAKKLHFGLGRWVYVYWNFVEGSRYVEYLRQLGLSDHDHMIQFTLISFHRCLNDRPQEIEKRVAYYKEERAKDMEELKKRQTIIKTETRKIERTEKKGN